MGVIARNQGRKRNRRMVQYLDAVAEVHGPAPINVFKECRLNYSKTMEDVYLESEISKQALIRTEQGTYVDPPDRLITYYMEVLNLNYLELVNDYHLYQKQMRRRHSRLFGSMPTLEMFYEFKMEHPLSILRHQWTYPNTGWLPKGESYPPVGTTNNDLVFDEPMNCTEVSKLLCVNQSVINYFENKVKQQASVPVQLLEALRDAGYTVYELGNFEMAYERHRNYLLKNPKRVDSSSKAKTFTNEVMVELTGVELNG